VKLGILVASDRNLAPVCGITRAATAYHEGAKPEIKVGRQLGGSTVGLIGYVDESGVCHVDVTHGILQGEEVWVTEPGAERQGFPSQRSVSSLLARSLA
jgi:hypothetical protein